MEQEEEEAERRQEKKKETKEGNGVGHEIDSQKKFWQRAARPKKENLA